MTNEEDPFPTVFFVNVYRGYYTNPKIREIQSWLMGYANESIAADIKRKSISPDDALTQSIYRPGLIGSALKRNPDWISNQKREEFSETFKAKKAAFSGVMFERLFMDFWDDSRTLENVLCFVARTILQTAIKSGFKTPCWIMVTGTKNEVGPTGTGVVSKIRYRSISFAQPSDPNSIPNLSTLKDDDTVAVSLDWIQTDAVIEPSLFVPDKVSYYNQYIASGEKSLNNDNWTTIESR
jgi:hypothetical protein